LGVEQNGTADNVPLLFVGISRSLSQWQFEYPDDRLRAVQHRATPREPAAPNLILEPLLREPKGVSVKRINGKTARDRKLAVGDVKDDSEIVVTYLARPISGGTTNRIRLKETYVDAKSLYLDGDELVWDRSFGRLRNTVVLPPGWYITALSAPSTIQTLPDGRVSIYIVNPRNDDVRVYLRARKRVDANPK
jgi:hypothetical protein